MTVVVFAYNSSALPGFDKPFPESGISDIIAKVRYIGACLCAVGDGVIYVHFDGKTAINSVGQFDACFHELQHGNVLLVWRLDRLGRSVRRLVTMIDQLQEMGVGFRSVCDGVIDTTTPSGELIFHVFSARPVRATTYSGTHKGGDCRRPARP